MRGESKLKLSTFPGHRRFPAICAPKAVVLKGFSTLLVSFEYVLPIKFRIMNKCSYIP